MPLKHILSKFSGQSPVVLELDLARGLIEHRPNNPLQLLQLINATSMGALREKLRAAAKDDKVRGLIVHAVGAQQPPTVFEEAGELIEEFGASKPTLAWAESFGEMTSSLASYTMATAAHQVWVQPTGSVVLPGLELHMTLFKGFLNKIGVEPQFGQRHEYKTAANTYAADEVTEPHREMMQTIAQSIVDQHVAAIARRREVPAETVWTAINEGFVTPERAKELGLVDHIGYRDEVYSSALGEWESQPDELRFVMHYKGDLNVPRILAQRSAPKVAVVNLRGAIVTGRGNPGGPGGESAGSDVVDEQLRQALRDDKVKAVLFAVDSPGGSAVASDFIRRGVLRLKEAGKPIVAHMGSVAASGGYYVSMGCNEIVAHRSTLTGSIGVLAGKLVTQGLYEKLDFKREVVRVGEQAGAMSPVTEMTEEEWEVLNRELDRIYHDFTTFAATDRGMAYEELEPLARGRVWTGADAKSHGLVDHLGGRRLALERVCDLAGLDPDKVHLEAMGHPGLIDRFMPAQSSESKSGTGVGVDMGLPQVDELLSRGARILGLPIDGALSLPFTFDLR